MYEKSFRKEDGVLYVCLLKELIQTARTSLLAGIVGYHFEEKRIARLRLEREKKKPTQITVVVVRTEKKESNTNHVSVVGTEKNFTDRYYGGYVVRTINWQELR